MSRNMRRRIRNYGAAIYLLVKSNVYHYQVCIFIVIKYFSVKFDEHIFITGSYLIPGPFLPCQDLFDWWTLRCGVWIVFLLAMLGNGTVVFVLIFSRSKMDVPRFLVCNLAAADFFMGIYLGLYTRLYKKYY